MKSNKLQTYILITIFALLLAIALCLYPLFILTAMLATFTFFLLFKTDPKKFFYFFLIIYPLIPAHAGINLTRFLPVIKFQRILYMMLLFCWLSKKTPVKLIRDTFEFPLTKYLSLFFIVFAASYIPQDNLRGFLFKTGTFTIENFAISLIIFDIFRKSNLKDIKKVYLFMSVSITLPLFFGIIEHFFKFNPFTLLSPFDARLNEVKYIQFRLGIGRVKAAFIHPIIYGLFFSFTVPAGLTYFIDKIKTERKTRHLLITFLFIISSFIGTTLSLSRLAIATFIINSFSFLLLYLPNLGLIIFLTFFTGTIPSLLSVNPKNKIIIFIQNFINKTPQNEEIYKSSIARIKQIEKFLPEVKKRFWLGSGGHMGIEKTGVIDNYYLRETLNSGFLGIFSILLFFLIPLMNNIIYFLKTPSRDLFKRLVYLTTIISIISSFFTFAFLTLTDYLILVWIYIGISFAVRYNKNI